VETPDMTRRYSSYASSIVRRAADRSSRTRARNSIISRDRPPWTVTAVRHRASPAAVFGPVDPPPCIRHRPFRIGIFLQEVPPRVRAPQVGTDSDATSAHESF